MADSLFFFLPTPYLVGQVFEVAPQFLCVHVPYDIGNHFLLRVELPAEGKNNKKGTFFGFYITLLIFAANFANLTLLPYVPLRKRPPCAPWCRPRRLLPRWRSGR